MASVFTRIIEGEFPGRFVWRDERVVAFLTIAPISPGHTLVVPIEEVDHWIDLDDDLLAHLSAVAKAIGRAQQEAFRPAKVALLAAGLEVPHVHLHVFPIDSEGDISFAKADHHAPDASLDEAAARIRGALRRFGHPEVSD
ncbi:MAG: HIT family protein [Actinobacteria bacterium]|nr:MAG: HIT family protein [Actinomycetota bacterium]